MSLKLTPGYPNHILIRQTLRSLITIYSSALTSSMTLTQVGESPHITKPNAEAHTG